MISSGQYLSQKQALQQRLSPQQIQFIKLLQLPTIAFEQRVKEELEENPVLDEIEYSPDGAESLQDASGDSENQNGSDEDINWDDFLKGTDRNAYKTGTYSKENDFRELPNPYHETFLEELEKQVTLLRLNEKEKLIADQLLGSIDEDGYLRRDLDAIIDSIAFNHSILINKNEVESVLKRIQRLDPAGVAARNLRECLMVQLETLPEDTKGRSDALNIVEKEWKNLEKKHFDKIQKHLGLSDDELKEAYECIQTLNPKPGGGGEAETDSVNYVVPDFEVYFEPAVEKNGNEANNEGEFIVTLNNRNIPNIRISSQYKRMWDSLKGAKDDKSRETKAFIKDKIDSAQWFLESIRQRHQTLMNVMKTIVALQEDFFKTGEGIKPMILKDIASRVGMDISTISRVVNGKYVQTNFGVYELKYFFNEGVETESGEEVSNREIKNLLEEIIKSEDKSHPLSDQAIVGLIQDKGYKLARRTISKYREQLGIPVARLRKEL